MNKKIITTSTVWLAPFIYSPQLSHAATYHVSPSGNDSGTGSNNDPFKTIIKSKQVLTPGDTLIIAPGTYSHFQLSRSGSAANPITVVGDNVKLDSTTSPITIKITASHIKVSGFEISGAVQTPVSISSNYVEFSDFVIHDNFKNFISNSGNCYAHNSSSHATLNIG